MANGAPASEKAVQEYAARLKPEFESLGVEAGNAAWNDDHYPGKLEVVISAAPAVVSFTFGCPSSDTIHRLHSAGSAVWVTVCDPSEARTAVDSGADALVIQGVEAGGHSGAFEDRLDRADFGLLALLQLVRKEVGPDFPLVAAGGIATGEAAAGLLVAGASAVQVGSGFLLASEAGTHALHRAAVSSPIATSLTRAWSGRLARGVLNRFQSDHSPSAPCAYPEIHFLTSPLRAAARAKGDGERMNAWAGETHSLAREGSAGEIVERFEKEMQQALRKAERLMQQRK